MKHTHPIFHLMILIALIPATLLAVQRMQYEQHLRTVTLTLDLNATRQLALITGQDVNTLLKHHRALGVNGLALTENQVQDQVARGELAFMTGEQLRTQHPTLPFRANWFYYQAPNSTALTALSARYTLPRHTVNGWLGFPINLASLPAGPDLQELQRRTRQGWVITYRPQLDPRLTDPGKTFPQVPFLMFQGNQTLPGTSRQDYLQHLKNSTAHLTLIEFTEQKGLPELTRSLPTVRAFSLTPEHQKTLTPEVYASKMVLAARERGMQILYLRPYPRQSDTDRMLRHLTKGLKKAGIQVGRPHREPYQPNPTLKQLALIGPIAALLLLVLQYPARWQRLLITIVLPLLAVLTQSTPYGAGALLSALVFPALGFVLRHQNGWDWLRATALSFLGVLFLTALGANHPAMLGLEPFQGVSYTLLIPVLLVVLHHFPPGDVRATLQKVYALPLKAGDLALLLLGVTVVLVVFFRRGNDAGGFGPSSTELDVRTALQDLLIRPRFKELAGHPLALIALSSPLPVPYRQLLLLGGVVGQTSLVNTFEHFHTPMLISLLRATNGVWLGLVLGLLGMLLGFGLRTWWNAHPTQRQAPRSEVSP